MLSQSISTTWRLNIYIKTTTKVIIANKKTERIVYSQSSTWIKMMGKLKMRKISMKKQTEYWSKKPAITSLGIAIAPLRSSKVSVIPIPSIVMVNPQIDNWGLTQLKESGFKSPIKHPKATHIGNAVETASLRVSINPLNDDLLFALKLFDELPQRSWVQRLVAFLGLEIRKRFWIVGNEMGFINWVEKLLCWHFNLNGDGICNCEFLLGRDRNWVVGLTIDGVCLLLLGKRWGFGVLWRDESENCDIFQLKLIKMGRRDRV